MGVKMGERDSQGIRGSVGEIFVVWVNQANFTHETGVRLSLELRLRHTEDRK